MLQSLYGNQRACKYLMNSYLYWRRNCTYKLLWWTGWKHNVTPERGKGGEREDATSNSVTISSFYWNFIISHWI